MADTSGQTFLARWLAGRLTSEEESEFKNSDSYADYVRIISGLDRFQRPSFGGPELKSRLLQIIEKEPVRRQPVIKLWVYAAAASLLLLFGLGAYLSEKHYVSGAGSQELVLLPDGTKVRLNAGTEMKHSRFFWNTGDGVTLLEGEAFFEVEKGQDFHVSTPFGTVRVLGTQFNILARGSRFELACYSGRVSFDRPGSGVPEILEKGDLLEGSGGTIRRATHDDMSPQWTEGRSVFRDQPLYSVLEELMRQYDLEIEINGMDTDTPFSGSFVHNDLQTALKSVLLPMGIDYEIEADQKTVRLIPKNGLRK